MVNKTISWAMPVLQQPPLPSMPGCNPGGSRVSPSSKGTPLCRFGSQETCSWTGNITTRPTSGGRFEGRATLISQYEVKPCRGSGFWTSRLDSRLWVRNDHSDSMKLYYHTEALMCLYLNMHLFMEPGIKSRACTFKQVLYHWVIFSAHTCAHTHIYKYKVFYINIKYIYIYITFYFQTGSS